MLTLLCAVFSTAWGETVTFTAGTDTGETSVTKDGITVSMSTMSRTDNYRTYSNSDMTVSSSFGNITKVEITCTGSGESYSPKLFSLPDGSLGEYSYDNNIGTWSGSASTLSLHASAQVRITQIVVTYEGSAPVVNVEAPTFSLAEGTYNEPISVELSCETEGADIYYTTNEGTPDATSTKYTGAITISETTTIKAIAIKGEDVSAVASATYTIITPVTGYNIDFESENAAYTDWVFTNIVSKQTGAIDAHGGTNYGTTGGKATGSITTKAKIATPSSLTCYVSKTTDNSTACNWTIQVSSDGTTWKDVATTSASSMKKGDWVEFTADLSDYTDVYVRVYYGNNSTAVRAIDDLKLIDTPAVSRPVFDPAAGTYTTAQSVTITCATEGATIYYTTDETDPTQESTLYSSPVSITTTGTTLKAIAVKDGLLDSNVASATYTIQPEAPVISEQDSKIVITAANGLTIYCTTDGSDPTNENEENKYTEPIPFSGTVTVKAIAYDTYGNPSAVSTKTFEFTNIRPNPKNINSGYYVKVADASELEAGDAILFVSEIDGLAMSTIQNANNRGAAEVTLGNGFIVDPSEDVQKVILTVDPEESGVWYFYVDNGYLYAASSSSNYLRTEDNPDDNAKATISISNGDATIQFQGTNTRNILKYNPNTANGSPLFSCYSSSSTNTATTQIYKEVEAQTETVNIGSTKYATLYYGTENLIVPANVTAMTYKASGDKIAVSKTYASGEVIPKGTAVVLEGTAAGAYKFFVTKVEGEGDSESDLYGLDEAGTTVAPGSGSGSYLFYKLSTNSAGAEVGFYFGAENGAAFNIPAHKAYLAIPGTYTTPGGASAFVFDETVGINTVQKEALSAEGIYTLSGIRVNGDNLTKGIYIVNGKKIVIK